MKEFSEDVLFKQRVTFSTLPDTPTSTLKNSTTPSVANLNTFKACGSIVTITNFLQGSIGQVIYILGDGTTTIQNNANIVTSTGADVLLTLDTVYQYHLIDDVWYEKKTSGTGITNNCYVYPGVSDQKTTLGNMTDLNAAAKVSCVMFMACIRTGAQQALFARYDDNASDTKRQLFFGLTASQQLLFVASAGGANISVATSAAGRTLTTHTYKLAFVYDGTQVVANDRLKMYYSLRDDGTLTYPAVTPDVITYSGTAFPTTLQSPASVVSYLGGDLTGAFPSYFGGFQLDVRLWIGTALSQAQIDAEVLATNVVPASHYWNMLGNLNDTGTTGGFNGTPSLTVIPGYYAR